MKLFLISIGSVLVVAMALLTTRFWGLSQPPVHFEHAWNDLPRPWIVVSWALRDQAPPETLLWLDVVQSKEQNLFVVPIEPKNPKELLSDSVLKEQGQELKFALEELKGRNLVLNILANEENIDLKISDLIGPSGKGRILIQSPYDAVLESIKKLQPLWLYGSSQAERVRFRTFQSMGILPATPFKGDVYVGPLFEQKIELLTEDVLQEVHRRGKKVIIGPLRHKEDWDLAQRLGADGVFIDQSELLGLTSSL